AEDGIRDFHVTGVQTCALPIFRQLNSELAYQQTLFEDYAVPQGEQAAQDEEFSLDDLVKLHERIDSILEQLTRLGFGQEIIFDRSEERRVGKERRCRRTAER